MSRDACSRSRCWQLFTDQSSHHCRSATTLLLDLHVVKYEACTIQISLRQFVLLLASHGNSTDDGSDGDGDGDDDDDDGRVTEERT